MASRMSPRSAGGTFANMRWLSRPFVVDHCVCTYMKTRFCNLAGTSYFPMSRCNVDMMSRNCALDLSKELIIAVMLPRMAANMMAPMTTMALATTFSTIVSGWTHGVLIRVVNDQYNADMYSSPKSDAARVAFGTVAKLSWQPSYEPMKATHSILSALWSVVEHTGLRDGASYFLAYHDACAHDP